MTAQSNDRQSESAVLLLAPHVLEEVGRRRVDVTRAEVYGVPANFVTAMRYPCHDRDILRDLLAEFRRTSREALDG